MRAEKVGADTMLARIVAMVARSAAQPRADPAPRRHGLGLVRARGHRWSPSLAFIAWAIWGPPPALRLRADRGGLGPHHRLPLRARSRDADVDHGRRRQGRDGAAS